MILLGNLLRAVAFLLGSIINLMIIIFVVRALISWFSPDPRNPLVQFLYGTTEPILSRVRSKIPPIGMLDLSVIAVIFFLYFLDYFLVASLSGYANLILSKTSL